MSTDLFFPENTGRHGNGAAFAKSICSGCPVRIDCLEFALDGNEQFGVFGGLTPGERMTMRKRWT